MKKSVKIPFFVFIIAIPGLLLAQVNPLDSFIDKYEGAPGFYYLDLKTNMFNLNDEEKGLHTTQNKIIDFKIVSFEKRENSKFDPTKIYNDFNKTLKKDMYKGLVEVKSSGENINMMVKKEGDQLTEIVIIVQEKDETTLMVATGNFDLKDIAKLRDMKNCKGLQALEKLCED